MIARFHIFLPFDLFITDEEQLGIVSETSNLIVPGARFTIPTAWGYSERPDPTGTVHDISFGWLDKIKDPAFSDSSLYDNRRVARVNVIVLDFKADDFDRATGQVFEKRLIIESAYGVANDFLARLRVYARLPQVRALIADQDPWQVQFLTDGSELIPREEGKVRLARSGSVGLGVFAFKRDAVKTVGEKWENPEPYVWDQLLLDAHSLWPNVGSSIVTAFAALETFIAWALKILQATNQTFTEAGWKWIMSRDHWSKDPSVEEQYDILLSILANNSLKNDQKLWTTFKELKGARNKLVHEGLAQLRNGTPVDARKAKILIDGAANIIDWVESLLPEAHRRHNKGFATPVARRYASKEQAALYDQPEGPPNLAEQNRDVQTQE